MNETSKKTEINQSQMDSIIKKTGYIAVYQNKDYLSSDEETKNSELQRSLNTSAETLIKTPFTISKKTSNTSIKVSKTSIEISIENCISAARLLLDSGINIMEVAYRTKELFPLADKCISAVRENVPKMFIGAATVINTEIADRALSNGAFFALSPGFNERVTEYFLKRSLPFYPGVATPSDIEKALYYGLEVLKFFPCEALGGVKMLEALSGPFPEVKFIVSGGINKNNYAEYQKLPNVIATSGTYLIKDLYAKK